MQLNGERFVNNNFCQDHPDARTHARIAAQVAAFLEALLPPLPGRRSV